MARSNDADHIVALLRFGWLTLAGTMGVSRIAFQLAGPLRMRAFLDLWKECRTKRIWGALLATYTLVLLTRAAPTLRNLSRVDRLLLALFALVGLGDSLLNLLPGSFGRFKTELQDHWVRRQRDPARREDRALFGTVNLLFGLASIAMAVAVIGYRPITRRLIAGTTITALLLTGLLVVGARHERRFGG